MPATARAIVNDYLEKVWNDQEVERVRDICADPIIRHDAKLTTALSHEEQIARIFAQASRGLRFDNFIVHGDENYVTAVWNVIDKDGGSAMSGIEVFKVTDGRISDVWNSTYVEGHWA